MELDRLASDARQLYAEMGAVPVINAIGNMTMLGGSAPAPAVLQAMAVANRYFVDMDALLESSGRVVADMLGCQGALITPGCSSALLLGTAACITGADAERMNQLPDLTGLKSEVVVQRGLRYKYERVVRMAGVRLVEVGSDAGTAADEMKAALGDDTAAVLHPVIGEARAHLPVEQVIEVAHGAGVPVIVDAAYQVYPVDGLRRFTDMGADLVGYGAKYFGALNSSGLLCGRADLVEAARLHAFASFEKSGLPGYGRPMKIDRQEVIAVVVALREWLGMDHEVRHQAASRRGRALRAALEGVPGLELSPAAPEERVTALSVTLPAAGPDAEAVLEQLRAGNPGIWASGGGPTVSFSMYTVADGDEPVIAVRLREILSA